MSLEYIFVCNSPKATSGEQRTLVLPLRATSLLLQFLSSDVKSGGAGRQMKSEQ